MLGIKPRHIYVCSLTGKVVNIEICLSTDLSRNVLDIYLDKNWIGKSCSARQKLIASAYL